MRLLRAHPRHAEDFEDRMPDDVRRGAEEGRQAWLFRQASVWPDIVRNLDQNENEQYNRPKWHYVNWPLFLSAAEKSKLEKSVVANLEDDPASAADSRDMNIFQAISYNAAVLKDRGASDADRAVALCWIAHLVQDIHQPLHTTSLFTTGWFAAGDRGGNLLTLSGEGKIENLHAFWDSMASVNQSDKMIRRRAAFLVKRHRQMGIDAAEAMSVEAWVGENRQLILKYVYTPEMRQIIKQKEAAGELVRPIRLDKHYQDRAQEISEIRIMEAGFRLANLLNQLRTD